ncbi:reverse transcriptase domain-containing protein [Tanacetum coccineum]
MPTSWFLELHQIDTFYNALTQSDQDSLNAAAGGNLLNRTPRDALTIIENKSKIIKEIVLMNKATQQATMKAIEETYVTCGGPHPYYECLVANGNTFNASAATWTYNQGVQGYRPQGETNYRASNQMGPPGNQNYQAPLNQTQVRPTNDFSNYMKTNDVNMRAMQNQISNMKTKLKKELQTTMLNQNNELKNDLKNMMSNYFQMQSPSGSRSLPSNTNANSRCDLKAITTRNDLSYDGHMIPPTSSPLPKEVEREPEATKDKVQTTSTAHVQPSVVQVPILEPDVAPKPNPKPSIPYPSRLNDQNLREKNNNQMLKKLSLPKLTLTRMTLELANRSIAYPFGVAEDVFVKVGKFHFLTDFVVVDYDVDPRVPLILRRPFLRTARALIDVYGEEFSDSSKSGNPTPSDPIIASSSPLFTPFKGGDFILEEIETFLHTPDNPSNLSDDYYDTDGDILYLEKLLNEDPSPNLPLMKNEDLKQVDVTMTKPSIEEPPKLKLKDLPPHLEYAFLEGNNKLPIIISKELKDEEKAALLTVLKSHKRAIAWKISDIKGIDPHFCTHKILMEDDFKPTVQNQRRVNPKIHEVIKKEVIKLIDAGLSYPISDSPWVSPVHCVPKKDGMTIVERKDNELIPTRLVMGWREKCHFMVKEGIVLGHKISKSGIEVDRAKVDVIAKLPHPTSVKGTIMGQRKTKHFQPIYYASKTMTDAQAHYTTTEKELLAVVYAFEKFQPYLVLSKTIMYMDHSTLKYHLAKQDVKPRLLWWILLLQEFDVV